MVSIRPLALCALASVALTAFAQAPGELDPTWGDGGIAVVAVPEGDAGVTGVAVDTEGRVVVAGVVQTGPTDHRAVIARLTAEGTLDSSFGDGGRVLLADLPITSAPFVHLALHPDGRPVVALIASTAPHSLVLRLRTDGTPDPTFGDGGRTALPDGYDVAGSPNSLLVEPDGGVALLTSAPRLVLDDHTGDLYPFGVVRLTADGALDPEFFDGVFPDGAAGTVRLAFGATRSASIPHALAREPDGRLLVGGQFYLHNGPEWPAVARLDGGWPDNAFGLGGTRLIELGLGPAHGEVVALAPVEGRVVAAGDFTGRLSTFSFARLTQEGRLDPDFGDGGLASVAFADPGEPAPRMAAVLTEPDGAVLGVGTINTDGVSGIGLARLRPDGTPDPAFGDGGRVVLRVGSSCWVTAAAAGPDGRAYLGGSVGGRPGLSVLRVLGGTATAAGPPPSTDGLRLVAAPNPARGTIRLTLTLETPLPVLAEAFDVQGRRVAVLHDGLLHAGAHTFTYDVAHLAPGTYLVRVTAGSAVVSREMTVVH